MAKRKPPRYDFAAKLNRLFATVTRDDGKEYTNEQVAAMISTSKSMEPISMSYLWSLRRGTKENPGYRHIQSLANFFGVPVGYFFEEDPNFTTLEERLSEIKAEREQLDKLLSNNDVKAMALRAGELSAEGRRKILDLIEFVHQLEDRDN